MSTKKPVVFVYFRAGRSTPGFSLESLFNPGESADYTVKIRNASVFNNEATETPDLVFIEDSVPYEIKVAIHKFFTSKKPEIEILILSE